MIDNKRNDKNPKKGILSDAMWLSTIGIHLVVCSIIGLFTGYLLDKWLHTQPLFMFIFFIIGLIAGFRQIYKEIKKIGNQS
jgi:ATP synthase protein I